MTNPYAHMLMQQDKHREFEAYAAKERLAAEIKAEQQQQIVAIRPKRQLLRYILERFKAPEQLPTTRIETTL